MNNMKLTEISNSLSSITTRKSPTTTRKSPSYSYFNKLLFFSIFAVLSGVAGLNWLVDPYGVFRVSKVQGFNHEKPQKFDNDRLFKTTDIIHLKPATILLGSSRMRQGLNPESPLLQEYLPVYNLGLNGSNIYELRKYLEHSITNNPNLKRVILGIDFFMFNGERELQTAFVENRLNKKHFMPNDLLNTLFSLTALSDSKATLIASQKSSLNRADINYGDNGFLPYRNPDSAKQEWRFQSSIRQYLDFHDQYRLSPEYLQEYRKIVEICRQQGIELKVFISPAHAIQWETIAATGEWNTFEQWKREIVKINPVWDFSGYNSITTESLKKPMENYTDSSHYTPQIGDLMLKRLFNKDISMIPQDFGVLMTPDNLESHLKSIRKSRKQWQENHLEEQELVRQVKKEFDQKTQQ